MGALAAAGSVNDILRRAGPGRPELRYEDCPDGVLAGLDAGAAVGLALAVGADVVVVAVGVAVGEDVVVGVAVVDDVGVPLVAVAARVLGV